MPHPTLTRFLSIGEILLQQQLITEQQLKDVLALQKESGERIGRIIVTQGYVSNYVLHRAIAQHYQLPFLNLRETALTPSIQSIHDLPAYIEHQIVPVRQEGDITLLATSNPTKKLAEWAEERFGGHYTLAITSPYDIYWHIDRYFSEHLDEHSRNTLWDKAPLQSARIVITPAQRRQFMILASILIVLLINNTSQVIAVILLVMNLFYGLTLAFKALIFWLGRHYQPGKIIPLAELDALDELTLPIYTLLIPLHDEAESLPKLVAALDRLDYPKAKLDIKLIVERADVKTINAIKLLKPHSGYEIIYVPYSLPQTKPKACNYALHFARGELVTIYDAEDEPDPLQLKKAVYWFRRSGKKVVCLQSRLNYYNRNHSLLTKLFAIEYAAWFDFMLPGLHKLGVPIPLGGTSNHLYLSRLKAIGEWDPYNVTEDADLGVRLAINGYETDMLDSLTAEEAPIHLRTWMNQRTRWVRGYMQTWLVHMRNPAELMKQLSPLKFWGFQFFIGGPCLIFLTAPILWVVSLAWSFGGFNILSPLAPWIGPIAWFNLGFGILLHGTFALFIIRRYRWKSMFSSLLFFPFYWLLHSFASFKALWQLAKNPHLWEKTPHGLSTLSASEKATNLDHMQ